MFIYAVGISYPMVTYADVENKEYYGWWSYVVYPYGQNGDGACEQFVSAIQKDG